MEDGIPPKARFSVKWTVNDEDHGTIHYFRLVATHVPETEGQARVVTEQINDPLCRCAEICLEPGNTYTLSLENYYLEGGSVQRSLSSGCITAPTINIGIATSTIVNAYYRAEISIHLQLWQELNKCLKPKILLQSVFLNQLFLQKGKNMHVKTLD